MEVFSTALVIVVALSAAGEVVLIFDARLDSMARLHKLMATRLAVE